MTYETVFFLILATLAVSLLYPWHPSWPKATWLVHLPLLLLPLWAWYEALMPSTMNIRVDLLFIIGAVRLMFIIYILRLVLFWWLRRDKQSAQSTVGSRT